MSNFTKQSETALSIALETAKKMKMGYIGSEHILLGLCQAADGLASNVLYNHGVRSEVILEEISADVILGSQSILALSGKKNPEYTSKCESILENASLIANKHRMEQIGTEHILLAIILDGECQAYTIMQLLGVNFKKVCREILKLCGRDPSEYRDYVKDKMKRQDIITGKAWI